VRARTQVSGAHECMRCQFQFRPAAAHHLWLGNTVSFVMCVCVACARCQQQSGQIETRAPTHARRCAGAHIGPPNNAEISNFGPTAHLPKHLYSILIAAAHANRLPAAAAALCNFRSYLYDRQRPSAS
jgi:hypothetical protein